jgi:hypothetical protein
MARKSAEKLTNPEVAKRLFPPEVRKWLRAQLEQAEKARKPAKPKRKT